MLLAFFLFRSLLRRRMKSELNRLQTLRGSLSAVSTPIFARKFWLESAWRDLQYLHTPPRPQNSSSISSFFLLCQTWTLKIMFLARFGIFAFCAQFWWTFIGISRQFSENGKANIENSRTLVNFAKISWNFRNKTNYSLLVFNSLYFI